MGFYHHKVVCIVHQKMKCLHHQNTKKVISNFYFSSINMSFTFFTADIIIEIIACDLHIKGYETIHQHLLKQ